MKKTLAGLLFSALLVPQAVTAAPPDVKNQLVVGVTAFDTSGAPVGTIERIADGLAVVYTGANRVSVPLTSFGSGAKGPVLAMTRAELDKAAQDAASARAERVNALLTPGSVVTGSGGTSVGTIKEVDVDYVTVSTSDGPVRLPRSAFGANSTGLIISLTADELRAAISRDGS